MADVVNTNLKDNGTLEIYVGNALLAEVENGRDDKDFVEDVLAGMGYKWLEDGTICSIEQRILELKGAINNLRHELHGAVEFDEALVPDIEKRLFNALTQLHELAPQDKMYYRFCDMYGFAEAFEDANASSDNTMEQPILAEFEVGDEISVIAPQEVTITDMGFFDEIEYDCYKLFKKYCNLFGFKIQDADEAGIDFYIAKGIQDKVLEFFEEAGIKINYYGELSLDNVIKSQDTQYNKIVKCDLVSHSGNRCFKDCYLLTGSDVYEELEIDLTSDFCFNTEFDTLNREDVASVNSVRELIEFCDKHDIEIPNACFGPKGYLLVGGCHDYVLNQDLNVLGWEETLDNMSVDDRIGNAVERSENMDATGQEKNEFVKE